jgi:hypothetical protein
MVEGQFAVVYAARTAIERAALAVEQRLEVDEARAMLDRTGGRLRAARAFAEGAKERILRCQNITSSFPRRREARIQGRNGCPGPPLSRG